MGLNETYVQARDHLLMMDSVPIVNRAYSMLMERENQINRMLVPNLPRNGRQNEVTTLMTARTG